MRPGNEGPARDPKGYDYTNSQRRRLGRLKLRGWPESVHNRLFQLSRRQKTAKGWKGCLPGPLIKDMQGLWLDCKVPGLKENPLAHSPFAFSRSSSCWAFWSSIDTIMRMQMGSMPGDYPSILEPKFCSSWSRSRTSTQTSCPDGIPDLYIKVNWCRPRYILVVWHSTHPTTILPVPPAQFNHNNWHDAYIALTTQTVVCNTR